MQNMLEALRCEYQTYQARNLMLDMTRGKPSPEQLALSDPLLSITATHAAGGIDCRNYGGLLGLPEAKNLFGEYLGVPPPEVIVGGNSSLAIMYDLVGQCLMRGFWGERRGQLEPAQYKFLCPVPGYDRHFAICERFGIKMIPVAMDDSGPDMNTVVELVKDPAVVGIWCVPMYSNPTGVTYSDSVVEQFASMKTGNPNFRIFWDNAYAVHHLLDSPPKLLNIRDQCKKCGTDDRVFIFGSTSKITFAGSGISSVAMSLPNIEWYLYGLQSQTIGPDKLNQLRHVLFLRDMNNVRAHMEQHRRLLVPKFNAAYVALWDRFGDNKTIARWTEPQGGYFISLDIKPDCAKRVVQLAGEVGVKLTPAGATFPYGNDPEDKNIRIAPSFPSVDEVSQAMKIVSLCIEIAVAEKKN